jgi:hypothetical protein
MFLVTLVLFGENPFEPTCLFVSEPPIDEGGMLTNDKFLATALTPQRPHFLKAGSFLLALPLLDCHSFHLLNFSTGPGPAFGANSRT